jgi:catechol 2,3-dioxygenase-like lactoylglutathione lyase family enzyme
MPRRPKEGAARLSTVEKAERSGGERFAGQAKTEGRFHACAMATAPALVEVLFPVADLARSRDFYVDLLGFTPAYVGGNFCLLRSGDRPTILLHAAEGETVTPGSEMFELRMEDVDRWYQDHAAALGPGVKAPFDVTHEGGPWSPRREVRISDPDGYRIVLFTPQRTESGLRRRRRPGPGATSIA